MFPLIKTALAAFVGLVALMPVGTAQCPIPDNLDGGPSCAKTMRRIPRLPKFKQFSTGICWSDCQQEVTYSIKALFSEPLSRPDCGPYLVTLQLRDAGLKWRGKLRLQYSRTWLETTPTAQFQVWRFLANGDLRPRDPALLAPCPVPPCASFFNNAVRFTGYVDYALECGAGEWHHAWMLTHACDFIDHRATFPRDTAMFPGSEHPTRAYTFVGPSANFVVDPLQPVEVGVSALEAVRRLDRTIIPMVPPITTCDFEEPVTNAAIAPNQQTCLCGVAAGPAQYVLSDVSIGGLGGTGVTTPGSVPLLPGFVSMGIGRFFNPGVYPGVESVRWNAASYDYDDPCTGVNQVEVFFGVTTMGGYTANQITANGVGASLPLTFIDQFNSVRLGATIMNVPFAGDHVLNLNF